MNLELKNQIIAEELQRAFDSRIQGNEGRARVCARRAAGFAIRLYFEQQTGTLAPKSAYGLLHWLAEQDQVEGAIREAAHRLTIRVLPDHSLPNTEDPLADAELIVEAIFEMFNKG